MGGYGGDGKLYRAASPRHRLSAPPPFRPDTSPRAPAPRLTLPLQLLEIPSPDAVMLDFSPQGGFLTTWRKIQEKGSGEKNLIVWSLLTRAPVLETSVKQMQKEQWPAVQFNRAETVAATAVTNLVNIYAVAGDALTLSKKLPLSGLNGFGLSPTDDPCVAAFVPEKRGNPGKCSVFKVSDLPDANAEGREAPAPVSQRSLMGAQYMEFRWNSLGTAVVMVAGSDEDKSNQSYYGKQSLVFMTPAGKDDGPVPLTKEGPVYDIQWAPSGRFFIAVHGFMPAKAVMFDDTCKAIFDFGSMPVNTIRWSPHSRFLALAGFGNLPGDIFFYDRKADGKCKQTGAVRNPAVTMEWSPCGRAVLTAITAPRLRVDNHFKVIKYTGEELQHEKFGTLLSAQWLPVPEGKFEDRPATPKALREKAAPAAGGAAGGGAAAAKPAAGPGAGYVPPHLRGKVGAGGAVDMGPSRSLAYDATDKGGKVPAGGAFRPSAPKGPVGYNPVAPMSKSAKKNAARRAKKAAE